MYVELFSDSTSKIRNLMTSFWISGKSCVHFLCFSRHPLRKMEKYNYINKSRFSIICFRRVNESCFMKKARARRMSSEGIIDTGSV